MKNLTLFFTVFLFTGLLYAQEVPDTTIRLDENTTNFAFPWQIALDGEKTVQFKTTGGVFRILILKAYEIFEEADGNVTIDLNSESPVSPIYTIRRREKDIEKEYYIFCITSNTWIEAPPKIIVKASR